MEAMASGALVFVDEMATPRQHPLIHDKHVIYYSKYSDTYIYIYPYCIIVEDHYCYL